jgi:hypothetical protein
MGSEAVSQAAEKKSGRGVPSLLGLFLSPRDAGPKTASKAHHQKLASPVTIPALEDV